MPDLERLLGGIDREWIAGQTATMVQIPSVTMDERDVCTYFQAQLAALGLDVDVREVTPGRNNLYACIRGTGGGPSLALNGHLDTIPIGAAWPYRRVGDRLHGRGTEDMKGSMAAMLAAARALGESGVRLKGDLWLTAVVGHEEAEARKDGPRALVEDVKSGRLPCERILIVEGDQSLWVMSMGSTVFSITMESDFGGSHTNNVPFGRNPIRFMGELVGALHDLQLRLDAGVRHPLAGAERVDLGIAQAGDYHNRTPLRVYLEGTRRWAPGKTLADVMAEIEAIARPIAEAGGLKLAVSHAMEREPFEVGADDAAVRAVREAATLVSGRDPELIGRRIVGDANIYVHGCGVPSFYFGPAYRTAHSDDEWVDVADLETVARVYAATAVRYCGVA
ncbi:MAG: M20/M25/M40 family metallo-hydrolase [Alphaproteobacteria bacterium]|nr:M20/M25/M40 family metallo-hydrolase [Alphaproteobacteria bacterium]